MKKSIYILCTFITLSLTLQSCFDLDEEVYSQVPASEYYKDEASVKNALASIYYTGFMSYIEYFFYLQEFSADQVSWRVWNGGLWGYDDGEKYVLSIQNWTPGSAIIRKSWETAWKTIGMCNVVLEDMEKIDPASIGVTEAKMNEYKAEARTLRAWAYYNVYEVWGGAIPLYTSADVSEIPQSVDPDFNTGCKIVFDFLINELDECLPNLPVNKVERMNQAMNRVLKARLLFNANVLINEDRFAECAALCESIIGGSFGTYSITDDHRDLFNVGNENCPELIMGFANADGQMNGGWMRNMPFFPYNIWDYLGGTYSGVSSWNCVILAPSYDNTGNVLELGGTDNPICFLDAPYNDKLGAIYERFDDRDIRKQKYEWDTKENNYRGMFLKGLMTDKNGTPLKGDADRNGQDLVYVDQLGTFQNKGRQLETVMSNRWGETNSGLRLMKYPMAPGVFDFRDAYEVEFRLTEVVFMLAECKMRAGANSEAKRLVDSVRKRYFSDSDWANVENDPGPGFTAFDMDWLLSQWGLEFLCEGRRRRTDLRRHDKFTQGQWWFFGRATEDGRLLPAQRDRKFEWYPLPESAIMVNPGLVQNPLWK